ncbi:MAG: hypothetical protein K6E96_02035 [Bacteroidales bacterium]|nr:hypothetical protein [Bacteroidales bacterium]
MRTPSKRFLLLLTVLAFGPAAVAQFNTTAQSAREGALGGVLIVAPEARGVALDWRRGWLQAEMASKSLRLHLPVGAGLLGVAYEHLGTADYHEQQMAAAYVLTLNDWLRAGVAARYLHLGTSDAHYTPQQWLAASVLMRAVVGRTTLTLLAGSRPWDDLSPWRLHLQAAYRPTPRWLTVVELEHEELTRMRMGLEYTADGGFRLRAGLATRPTLLTFGAGFRLSHFDIDLAAQVHCALGVTPQISLALWL